MNTIFFNKKYHLRKFSSLLHNNKQVVLLIATVLKAMIIYGSYQHLIYFKGDQPKIVEGYGWDQLVASMHQGEYKMRVQSGLGDILDLETEVGRPPIYSFFLFFLTLLGKYTVYFGIVLQAFITTSIAYLGYRLVLLQGSNCKIAYLCLVVLFFMPMNFLKTGTVDEAPLMLLFVLVAILYSGKYIVEKRRSVYLVCSALFFGLATLTRLTILPGVLLIFIVIFSERLFRTKELIIYMFIYIIVLSPWLIRSYIIYGHPILNMGGGRILFYTQSQLFIEDFPIRSIDAIEREYLREYYNSNKYLGELSAFQLDREFSRLAINEMTNNPIKFIHSLFRKARALLPLDYYPDSNNQIKAWTYVITYAAALVFFVVAILIYWSNSPVVLFLISSIVGIIATGIIYFIQSRHMYPVIMMMMITGFSIISQYRSSENS